MIMPSEATAAFGSTFAENALRHNLFSRDHVLDEFKDACRNQDTTQKAHVLKGFKGLKMFSQIDTDTYDRLENEDRHLRAIYNKVEPLSNETEESQICDPDSIPPIFADWLKRFESVMWFADNVPYEKDILDNLERRHDVVEPLIRKWRDGKATDTDLADLRLTVFQNHMAECILAAFAQLDIIVGDRVSKHSDRVAHFCVKSPLNQQTMIEDIHSITYNTLLQCHAQDENKRKMLENALKNNEALGRLVKVFEKYCAADDSLLSVILLMLILLEGVAFLGPFCAVFQLKEWRRYDALAFANKEIMRDETLHVILDSYQFLLTRFRPDQKLMKKIVSEFCEPLFDYYRTYFQPSVIRKNQESAVPADLMDILFPLSDDLVEFDTFSYDNMCMYSRHTANLWLTSIGYEAPFKKTKQPFPFMRNLGIHGYANGFETREDNYATGHGQGDTNSVEDYRRKARDLFESRHAGDTVHSASLKVNATKLIV